MFLTRLILAEHVLVRQKTIPCILNFSIPISEKLILENTSVVHS